MMNRRKMVFTTWDNFMVPDTDSEEEEYYKKPKKRRRRKKKKPLAHGIISNVLPNPEMMVITIRKPARQRPPTLHMRTIEILQKRNSMMSLREMGKELVVLGYIRATSKTPQNTVSALISFDIKKNGINSTLVRPKPGHIGLRKCYQ